MMVLIALVAAAGGTVGLFDARLHVAGHTFGQFNEVGLLALMLLFGFLATRVSLPWYYVAWFLVPIAGAYAVWKISWRAAYLPWRDWDLRPGEERGPFDVEHDLYRTRERMVHVRPD